MQKIVALAVLLLVVQLAFAQTAEEQMWKRVEDLHHAIFVTKDSATIASMVSEELTYGHSAGAIEDKAMMVRKATNSRTEYKNPQFEKLSLRIVKKTAYVRFNYRAGSVEKGVETPLNIGILQVWQKIKGKWLLTARQAVKINSK